MHLPCPRPYPLPRRPRVCCNALLAAYARASPPQWVKAVRLLELMWQRGGELCPDIVSYNTVMKACGNGSQIDLAFQVSWGAGVVGLVGALCACLLVGMCALTSCVGGGPWDARGRRPASSLGAHGMHAAGALHPAWRPMGCTQQVPCNQLGGPWDARSRCPATSLGAHGMRAAGALHLALGSASSSVTPPEEPAGHHAPRPGCCALPPQQSQASPPALHLCTNGAHPSTAGLLLQTPLRPGTRPPARPPARPPVQVFTLMRARSVEPSVATFGTLVSIASEAQVGGRGRGHGAGFRTGWWAPGT